MFVMLVAQTAGAGDLSPALHFQNVQMLQKLLLDKVSFFFQSVRS